MRTALCSIAPKGTISKNRWADILKSIGIEFDEKLMEWCLGRMMLDSQSVEELRYKVLLDFNPETD